MDAPTPFINPLTVRALANPARVEILRLLLAEPRSLSGLGRELGKQPASIRHHMKSLEAACLVRFAEERKTRNYVEHLYQPTPAARSLHPSFLATTEEDGPLIVLGSDDPALDMLTEAARATGIDIWSYPVGSLDGIIAVHTGAADLAGAHLFDPITGEFNRTHVRCILPDRDAMLVTVATREQGLYVAAGNPLRIRDVEDLANSHVRFLNRNAGSGTRSWLDWRVASLGIEQRQIPGYYNTVSTHAEAAHAVASGQADASIGIQAAAVAEGIGFVPLFEERYDLVVPEDRLSDERVQRLLAGLHEGSFVSSVVRMPGYSTAETGREFAAASLPSK